MPNAGFCACCSNELRRKKEGRKEEKKAIKEGRKEERKEGYQERKDGRRISREWRGRKRKNT
jgi:hypothetical protein